MAKLERIQFPSILTSEKLSFICIAYMHLTLAVLHQVERNAKDTLKITTIIYPIRQLMT